MTETATKKEVTWEEYEKMDINKRVGIEIHASRDPDKSYWRYAGPPIKKEEIPALVERVNGYRREEGIPILSEQEISDFMRAPEKRKDTLEKVRREKREALKRRREILQQEKLKKQNRAKGPARLKEVMDRLEKVFGEMDAEEYKTFLEYFPTKPASLFRLFDPRR